jgi:hypothetical protein
VLGGGRCRAVERHQTLRSAIDWSYELLTETERRLLARLPVFAGGCTLQAIETVVAGNPVDASAVFELVAGLVAKSLVVADNAEHEPARSTAAVMLLAFQAISDRPGEDGHRQDRTLRPRRRRQSTQHGCNPGATFGQGDERPRPEGHEHTFGITCQQEERGWEKGQQQSGPPCPGCREDIGGEADGSPNSQPECDPRNDESRLGERDLPQMGHAAHRERVERIERGF